MSKKRTNKSPFKYIIIIIGIIVGIVYILPILSLIFGIGKMYFTTHVDRKNKLSKEELEVSIKESLKVTYNEDFTLKLLKEEDVTGCLIEIDGSCGGKYNIRGAKQYLYEITDSNNIIAYVEYTDPYYDNNSLHKELYIESYGIAQKALKQYPTYEAEIKNVLGTQVIEKIEFTACEDVLNECELNQYFIEIYLKESVYRNEIYQKLRLLNNNLKLKDPEYTSSNYLSVNIIFEDEPTEKYSLMYIANKY